MKDKVRAVAGVLGFEESTSNYNGFLQSAYSTQDSYIVYEDLKKIVNLIDETNQRENVRGHYTEAIQRLLTSNKEKAEKIVELKKMIDVKDKDIAQGILNEKYYLQQLSNERKKKNKHSKK